MPWKTTLKHSQPPNKIKAEKRKQRSDALRGDALAESKSLFPKAQMPVFDILNENLIQLRRETLVDSREHN